MKKIAIIILAIVALSSCKKTSQPAPTPTPVVVNNVHTVKTNHSSNVSVRITLNYGTVISENTQFTAVAGDVLTVSFSYDGLIPIGSTVYNYCNGSGSIDNTITIPVTRSSSTYSTGIYTF